MRSMLAISPIIALSLTTPATAEQLVDQNTKQQIEQIITVYHNSWNDHNAAAIAELFTKDAILVTQAPQMVKNGQQEIQQNYEKMFAGAPPHQDSATADQIVPLATGEFISVGQYHLTGSSNNKIDGYWTVVYVPEGSKLKIRLVTAVPVPPAK